MKDVVLLEKSELTAGSTWHAVRLGRVYVFFPPQSAEVKAGNVEMHLYVGDPWCLCLGVCPSPRVQINDWVNPTVLLSCFPYINPDRGGVFVFVFAHKHVIRLLVSHKFFVLSVEHLVSTGLEMNW